MKSIFFEITKILGMRESTRYIVFDKIITHYTAPGRYYHNLKHIFRMWNNISFYIESSSKFSLLFLSCLYHDIIYDSKSNKNEENSFLELEKDFKEFLISHELAECKNLIIGTKNHIFKNNTFEHKIFLDSDLMILGAPENFYQAYSKAIRKEYSWVDEVTYKKERIKVLESFLTREKIYYTEIMETKYEEKARFNLQNEIMKLR